jgi:hypothetical protein
VIARSIENSLWEQKHAVLLKIWHTEEPSISLFQALRAKKNINRMFEDLRVQQQVVLEL